MFALLLAPLLAGCIGEPPFPEVSISDVGLLLPAQATYESEQGEELTVTVDGPWTIMNARFGEQEALRISFDQSGRLQPLEIFVDQTFAVIRWQRDCSSAADITTGSCDYATVDFRSKGIPSPFGIALPLQPWPPDFPPAQGDATQIAERTREGDLIHYTIGAIDPYGLPSTYVPDGEYWFDGNRIFPVRVEPAHGQVLELKRTDLSYGGTEVTLPLAASVGDLQWQPLQYDAIFPRYDRPLLGHSFTPLEAQEFLASQDPVANDQVRNGCIYEFLVSRPYLEEGGLLPLFDGNRTFISFWTSPGNGTLTRWDLNHRTDQVQGDSFQMGSSRRDSLHVACDLLPHRPMIAPGEFATIAMDLPLAKATPWDAFARTYNLDDDPLDGRDGRDRYIMYFEPEGTDCTGTCIFTPYSVVFDANRGQAQSLFIRPGDIEAIDSWAGPGGS